ncbi:MAG: HEAT repeat domain-containing protein [Gemmatimonadaceae bacterium]
MMHDRQHRRARLALASLSAFATLAGGSVAGAQAGSTIGRRVAAIANGELRMTYASRPDACGDGRDVVGMGSSLNVYSSIESYGRWSGVTCVHGPARVSVTVRDRQVVTIRPHIGGSWPATSDAAIDLGHVPAAEAAAYFLSLAPQVGSNSRLNPLLAAAIADSVNVVPDMLRLARSSSVPRETRRRALHWTGALGDASVVAPLVEIARADAEGSRDNPDDVGPGDKLQGAAVGALSMIRDGAGLPALMDLARRGSASVRKAAVFWLGQREERESRALVRSLAGDEHESESLRGAAIFALGQGSAATADERAFLRGLFAKLSSQRLQDRILMALAQGESADDVRWMLAQARDEELALEVRRKAVFWAGQGKVPIVDLVALYRHVREPRLREHVIFVLSQREEERAVQALFDIARSDDDHEMRKKALFWLAQKDDPRVTKLITDIIGR